MTFLQRLKAFFSPTPPPETWHCHDCGKDILKGVKCNYDWSGTCSAGDFDFIRDKGVPPTLGTTVIPWAEDFIKRWSWIDGGKKK